jgi:hydroxypyruvate reductase
VTLVYSDVSSGALADVASGPTIRSAEDATLIADNHTLTSTASAILGAAAVLHHDQIEDDVETAACALAALASELPAGKVLVAGGEPTVVRRGDGRGGRCTELALRFALQIGGDTRVSALFASSDGVDGSSGSAGVHIPSMARAFSRETIVAALSQSDSASVIAQIGEPIMISATGNNLRDLFLVARD